MFLCLGVFSFIYRLHVCLHFSACSLGGGTPTSRHFRTIFRWNGLLLCLLQISIHVLSPSDRWHSPPKPISDLNIHGLAFLPSEKRNLNIGRTSGLQSQRMRNLSRLIFPIRAKLTSFFFFFFFFLVGDPSKSAIYSTCPDWPNIGFGLVVLFSKLAAGEYVDQSLMPAYWFC